MDMNLVLQEIKMKKLGSSNLKAVPQKKYIETEDTNEEKLTKRTNIEETPEESVFVQSSMHRKGSRVYKNNGWKYSHTNSGRNSSASSFKSLGRHSSSEEPIDAKNHPKKSPEEIPPAQSIPRLSKKEMDNLLEKKFEDIFNILKSAGVEINMSKVNCM